MISNQFEMLDRLNQHKTPVNNFKGQDIYSDIHPFQENMIWLDNKPNT